MNQTQTTPFDQSHSFAEINGVTLHYVLEGDATNPTVLINMHSHNLTCWEAVLADLAEHFQILRFDLRGTGKSGWGDDETFNFSQYADDLAGLMDHLKLTQHLCGSGLRCSHCGAVWPTPPQAAVGTGFIRCGVNAAGRSGRSGCPVPKLLPC